MPIDSQRDIKFREIVDRYVVDRRAGKTPDKKEIAKQYPELAKDLKREFNRIDLLLQVHDNEDAVDITRAHAVVSTNRTRSVNSSTREKFKCLTPRVRDDNSDRLQVRCPECSHAIEIVTDTSWTTITCDSCNTNFNLASTETGNEQALTMIGHFEVRERVGMGAFGTVWRAYDRELDRDVAIKIPRKGQLTEFEAEYFLREARAAAQIRHPNIVRVYEVGRHDDRVFIASDFIEGVTLDQHLADFRLTIRESAGLVSKLASALQVAHDAGVVHRDLKPGNILLDRETQPHITDFGLAKHDSGDVTMTVDGAIVGTPAYMSPEQALGNAHTADCRTDVYSLGVILFELLTGARPFRGNTRMMINQVINEEPPSPLKLNSNVDRDLATITLKCLQKEPGRRYETAEHLADDLNRYLEGKPIHARPVGVLERSWRWCKRKPALASAIGVSTLLVAALAISGWMAAAKQTSLTKKADAAAKRATAVLQILTDSFESANPEFADTVFESEDQLMVAAIPESGSNAQMTATDVLLNARASLEKSELDDEGKAALLRTLTTVLLGLGEYKSAVESAEDEVAIRKELQGPDHRDTLASMSSLANAYRLDGNFNDAIRLGEQTRAAQIGTLGLNDPDTLSTTNRLANAYKNWGQPSTAIELYEQTLKSRTDVLGAEHLDTLRSMINLASAYSSDGDQEKALELCKTTLAGLKKVLPPDHPDTLTAMNGLGTVHYSMGQFKEAHDLYKQSLAARRKKLSPDHPKTITSMSNLALSLHAMNQLEEAKELYQQALDSRKRVLGADNPDTLTSMSNLAKCLLELGHYMEALKLREELVDVCRKKKGPNDEKTVDSTRELNEAMALATRHVRELIVAAQYQKAEDLADTIIGVEGQDKYQQKANYQNLHVVQMVQKKYKEAQKTIEQWIELMDVNERADRKLIAWATTSKAVCLLEIGDYSEAEVIAKEAISMEALDPIDRARCNGVLGVCLANQNNFKLAEQEVNNAFDQMSRLVNEVPPYLRWYTLQACERVVKVHEMSGTNDEVLIWRTKSEETRAEIEQLNESVIFSQQAQIIFDDTWTKVAPAPADDKPVLTEEELRLMRRVCVQYPKGLHFMALGIAEFRLGNYDKAIKEASKSITQTPKETNIPHAYPGDLAVMAMSYLQLGQKEKAEEFRSKLDQAMKVRTFTKNQECQSFVAEVSKMFD